MAHEVGHGGYFAALQDRVSASMRKTVVICGVFEGEPDQFVDRLFQITQEQEKLAVMRASAREFALAELDATNAKRAITRAYRERVKSPPHTKSTAGAPKRCQARFQLGRHGHKRRRQ